MIVEVERVIVEAVNIFAAFDNIRTIIVANNDGIVASAAIDAVVITAAVQKIVVRAAL
ncbi:MAG: hypothetical protein P8P56_00355 [Yoonia sp.]|nr:hypothetical protein [Yoonia sp.]